MKPVFRTALIALVILLVAALAFGFYVWRGNPSDLPLTATMGTDPTLVEPEPRSIPSVSLVETVGWGEGELPVAAEGLTVTRFADSLDHPRTMLTLPNGDVLVAETGAPAGNKPGGITGWFMQMFMDRVGAGSPSPDRIVLLRDEDGDGKAEARFTFREEDLVSPSGMAWGDDTLYIANHDAVLAFDYAPGPTELLGEPRKIMDLHPAGNHWMRILGLNPEGTSLYVTVGSASNIGERGMEEEEGRASIWEINLETGGRRLYGAGLRNANGIDWNPSTGEMWVTVQERDQLGPDLVPDYLTNVPLGVHYGWPWIYYKDNYDDRVDAPMPVNLEQYIRRPEYALGAHASALGMVFAKGGNRMGEKFANGAFVARHGSWNRIPPAGYDVIFVPFDGNGNPRDSFTRVLGGFLMEGEGKTRGRPTWLAWDQTGALLVSDDTAGIIWRVEARGAAPSTAPERVVTDSMPAQRELDGDLDRQFRARITEDYVVEE